MIDVSIIICCYNSSPRLPKTLEYMAKQKVDPTINWEVIIVDNNSTDKTSSVAIEEWKKWNSPISLRVVSEPEPGLSHARKKGIGESTGELIIFCDDDNWLDPDYIQLAFEIMNSNKKIGILGGIGFPVSEDKLPDWYEKYQSYFATGPQAKIDGPVEASRNWVYGAGMAMRREAYNLASVNLPLEICSDRLGKSLSSGGDTELCYKIVLSGYEIHYCSRLTFLHYLPAARLNSPYLQRLAKGISYSAAILYPYRAISSSNSHHEFVHGGLIKMYFHLIRYQVKLLYKHVRRFREHKDLDYTMRFLWNYGYHRGLLLNAKKIREDNEKLAAELENRSSKTD